MSMDVSMVEQATIALSSPTAVDDNITCPVSCLSGIVLEVYMVEQATIECTLVPDGAVLLQLLQL